MRLNKKAFTLTELLIALGVIGVLTAILLPVIMNLIPDQNVLMAKRAYYATQTIVSDMMNNEACYPDMTDAADESERRIGFDDGFPRSNCVGWNSEGDGENAAKKFSTLFFQGLDIKSSAIDNNGSAYAMTRDGMFYEISGVEEFETKNDSTKRMIIYVDVNGNAKPNRRETGTSSPFVSLRAEGTAVEAGKSTYDVFSMYVYANGKIEIRDSWAQKAVDVSKDVLGSD